MSEESESTFQPHSDEELARLLEEQMLAMRAATPMTAPQPVVENPSTHSVDEAEPELGIDDLFGALLEDTTDIPVVQVVQEEVIELAPVDESVLEHTQPITYIREEVVEAAFVDDHVIVEETVVEDVVEDAHVIAERVLSEISIDGEIVATTIAETAGSDPIPQMFGFAEVVESVPAPVSAVPVVAAVEFAAVHVEDDAVIFDEVTEVVEEEVFPAADDSDDVIVEHVIVEEVVEVTEVPQLRMNNPINSFAPRPTFDELVFGVKSED
ncbi:hypothetical protein [Aurantimicrobium minutum]|uniref:hypothetical protein n=1 Tax=Aurantimicrobium minutum TaxID=708131 RepID=UPI00247385A2|nr:hypothetical protein [Aurantimicrobium minutum]MDH6422505.1 hypothetical protein [Aurantimicrobium minutum]